jgi:hypothetical protein
LPVHVSRISSVLTSTLEVLSRCCVSPRRWRDRV